MADLTITDAKNRTVILTPPLTIGLTAIETQPIPGPVPPPSPPSVVPVGVWPNAPALPVISDYGFTDPVRPGVETPLGTSGWMVKPTNAARVSDLGALGPAPYALQMTYPIGHPSGNDPSNAWLRFPPVQELYVGLSWKPSSPWQGEPSHVNKICFLYMNSTLPGQRRCLVVEMYGPPGGPYRLRTALFETGMPEPREWAEANIAAAPLVLGTYHRIEVSCGIRDRVLRQWLNGTLVTQYTDIAYDPAGFDEVSLAPTWGGYTPGLKKTQADWFRYDHAHIRGR